MSAASLHVHPLLLAAALCFWGWQTRNALPAVGLALAILLPAMTRLRLELTERDQHRIADLTMVLYVAVAASFVATDGLRRGVHDSLVWLPGVVLPLMLAQVMDLKGRMPMTALFRYLRKLKARGEKVRDPQVDLTGPYLALILIASGMANQPGQGYFVGIVILIALALVRAKPTRVGIASWLAALAAAVSLGYGTHAGLYALQTLVEDWIIDLQLGPPLLDPYRSATRLGELGRLKAEDAIIMRIYAEKDAARPALLHQASYNRYVGTSWLARHGNLEAIRAIGDGTAFALAGAGAMEKSADSTTLRISQKVHGGRTLLALPLNASGVGDLVASRVRGNALGAVQAEMEVPWTFYNAYYTARIAGELPGYATVEPEDLEVPPKEEAALRKLSFQLGLQGMRPADALRKVEAYFAGFEYATARDRPFLESVSNETPLAEFLNSTHRGHCEFFATATTLLLRTAGIPARYATGYSIQDWSTWENAWIVRERHSHAWTRAFVEGRWTDIDTTPAVWFAEEESLAPISQKLVDFLRWAGFRWTTRDGSETKLLAWGVVGLAVLILIWKLATEGGLVRLAERQKSNRSTRPGADSDFYAVEAELAKTAPRRPGETLLNWVPRAGAALEAATRVELERLVRLHYRYRFDPAGLTPEERLSLSDGCNQLVVAARRVK